MFWITDTQYLSEYNSGLFKNTTQWIAKYYAACNGRMVVHTGDIVNTPPNVGGQTCTRTDDFGSQWTSDPQWTAASQAMTVLLDANIPYTWDAGNHDGCLGSIGPGSLGDGWIGRNYAAFNPSILQNASLNWVNAKWVGSDNEGMNTAVSFSGGGQNFLLVNIQYNGVNELAGNGWVQRLLSDPSYAGYHVIIATHDFINNLGGTDLPDFPASLTCMIDGCNGQKGYPNVFLTLNGHFHLEDQGYHAETASGRYELMFNRQDDEEGNGAATVTILTFEAGIGRIYVNTFDINNPPPGKDNAPLSSPSYEYQLDESFRLNQSSEIPVTCVPSYVQVGLPVTCSAEGGGSSLTGGVTWSSSDAAEGAAAPGSFSDTSCTLVTGACSVTYTPTERYDPTPMVMITASYAGGSHNLPSYGTASLNVSLATSKVNASCTLTPVIAASTMIVCRARVTGYLPTGNVTWSKEGLGVGAETPLSMLGYSAALRCVLSNGSCSLTMTAPTSETVAIIAAYLGDSNNQGSSGLAKLTNATTKTTTTTTTSTTATTTPPTSSSTTDSGGGLGISDFLLQISIAIMVAAAIVASYILVRRTNHTH